MSWSGQDILVGQNRRGILRVPSSGGVPEMLVPLDSPILSADAAWGTWRAVFCEA